MEVKPRSFWCFISYRHADNLEAGRQWATWLHQQIETYEVPEELVGTVNGRGDTIPERIFPVFRDEEELPADADLASPIFRALDASKFLVVLCSPKAVASSYVATEICYYKQIGRSDRVLAAIISGEPGSETDECFPEPLRHPVDAEGKLILGERAEPIAADFRLPDGSEGWTSPEAYRLGLRQAGLSAREIEARVSEYRRILELAKLKIIAGVLGIPLGTLTQRDRAYQLEKERRRARMFRRVAAAMALLMVAAAVGGVFALVKKQEAEEQRREAEAQRQVATEARDAESVQRRAAEDAKQVAEQRRKEADEAKDLAEKRRQESEKRLGYSNILLASRLILEGNIREAKEVLWQVPESEREWEWGYLLGQAYPEAKCFEWATRAPDLPPQGGFLDQTGRSAVMFAEDAQDGAGVPTPARLRLGHLQDDGSLKSLSIEMHGGLSTVDWSRNGHLLLVDGKKAKLFAASGDLLGEVEFPEEPESGGFVDLKGRLFVIKQFELWHLFEWDGTRIRELSRFEETFEGERFRMLSPKGDCWGVVSIDSGAAVYDKAGRLVKKFEGCWAPDLAIAEDGSVAIATVDEEVKVWVPGGEEKELAPSGEIIRRNTNGVTVRWMGRELFVRNIRTLRSWDMRATEPENAGTEWEFTSEGISHGMDVGRDWVAVSFTNGRISLFRVGIMLEAMRLNGHEGLIQDLRWIGPDRLASLGQDGTWRIWFPEESMHVDFDKTTPEGEPGDWKVSRQGDLSAAPLPPGPGHPFGTRAEMEFPSKRRLATTGDDGQMRVWNAEGRSLLLSLQGPARIGLTVGVSKDGRRLWGEFLTPGNDWNYEQVWSSEPWTRKAAGIDPEEDWRAFHERAREARFLKRWQQSP